MSRFIVPPENKVDGYKLGHRPQYPKKTQLVFGNLTPRNTRRQNSAGIVFFGLQPFLMDLQNDWHENFFCVPRHTVLARHARRVGRYLNIPPEEVDVSHLAELHDLGYLPLEVWALPEGVSCPYGVPPFVLWNTDSRFFWLTNYIETIMSCSCWLPSTSATTALRFRKILDKFADLTCDNRDHVDFQGHDFSYRGMDAESAAYSSTGAHMLCFKGTDTLPGIDYLEHYYDADADLELIGCSIPATEHSVMCAGGNGEGEEEATFLRLITEVYPKGPVAIVSDTWDFWGVVKPVDGLLARIKEKILARDGTVVTRPDSGDPVKIVAGEAYPVSNLLPDSVMEAIVARYEYLVDVTSNTYYKIPEDYCPQNSPVKEVPATPELRGAIDCLWETFGGTTTTKGFKLLDSHIRLIYGDSITEERAFAICELLMTKGFASANVVFGIGSFTYTYVTRDVDGFAMKATYCVIDDEPKNICKKPATDSKKNSAKGLLAVYLNELGVYYLKQEVTWHEVKNCAFRPVFVNGQFKNKMTLAEVRRNVQAQLT